LQVARIHSREGPTKTTNWLAAIVLFVHAPSAWASDGGSLLGTVTDPRGAVVPGATVAATETSTGVKQTLATDSRGFYSFQSLPVGRYDVEVTAPGFSPLRKTGVVIDLNGKVMVDVSLAIGAQSETVTVSESAARVETVDSQMGDVITGRQMTSVPLNGRSYTDLLGLQPGVVPVTSLTPNTQQDVGVSALAPSGDLNPGTISINGQREFANAFIVNGSDAEEDVNSGTAIIPNLDSIAEFRILTSNFDVEHGEHSGGQIEVVTKSGTNEFHGDAFEFLRNTDLDARNYFSPTRGAFRQNQFGGTFGGPIRRNKIFFFLDYQGTRLTQGVDTGQIPVPFVQDRAGDLSDIGSSLNGTVTRI
jgi:Carboxypeptidase regulatory-like domain